ncbi:hypothetical protein D9758_013250 [Tetrapyrgos nigripes]|uniref:Uncharacterized protein n=1 Tax=Tetrapyrgos nigripes TaxID=182062 RepID=A0A8H5FP33_9AGAR|nr:hypothetical protein D9758_013250 [Tetrapyrgos nigripes]
MLVMIRYNSATELCITKGQEGYVHGWKAKTGKHGKLVLDVLFIKLHKPPNPPAPIKFDGLPENVVPITRNTVRIECKLSDDSEIAISRTQVEILPNFAMTDFASQGKTRDWNVVDIHNSRDFRAIYIALSRSSCADQTLILQGFNTNLLTGGIKNKGGYRQELRELELLDEITRLKYLGILSPSVFGDHRSSLIKSFRTVQGINFVPASVHKSIEWNDSDPLPDTFDSGETWQIISADNETDQKNKRQLKGNFKTAKGATQNETKGRTLKRKAQAEEPERPSTTPKKKIKEDVPAQIQRNSASYLSYPSLRWFLNSCAYDSAIILLYYLYVNHFEIEMSHFTQILSMDLLDAFRSGITDLTAARENVRHGLHNIDSEAFSYGQYADAGEVLLALTQSDLSFSRSQVICTNNHVHKPWKNRTNMLLYMSTRMYQSTQQWVDNFVQPFGWQCQICHTELQTVIEFTRFPKFFLVYVPINASMEIDRMINLIVNGNQKPYDLKAIIYFGEEHFILHIFSNQAEYIYDGIKNGVPHKASILGLVIATRSGGPQALHLMFATFSELFGEVYGFDIGIGGLVYLGLGVGFISATWVGAKSADQMYHYLARKNGGVGKPEMRIPVLFFGSLVVPVGLFWYGWSAQAKIHWIMPIIGTAIFGFGLMTSFLPIQLYLVDTFTYAASALSAASTIRSLFGFGFPLFTGQMFDALGIGGGNSLLAGLAIVLGVPFPVWLYFNGEKMRARSKLAR